MQINPFETQQWFKVKLFAGGYFLVCVYIYFLLGLSWVSEMSQ